MKVLVTAVLLLISATAVFCATQKCRVCDQPFTGEFYQIKDKARGGKCDICTDCFKLKRCFSCSLPVKTNATTLADSRQLCADCGKSAITDDEEARRICMGARDDLDKLFARFLTFPRTNLSITFVDAFTLDSLFKSPGYAAQCTSVFGATRTITVAGPRFIHAISILNGLSEPQLEAVAAHEFAHIWLNENLSTNRWATLSPEAAEGFCELIAYNLMHERNCEAQKSNIRESPYTAGQVDAFIAAESLHGFNAVLEWIKGGETSRLDAADPDGIRAIRESPTVRAQARPSYYSYAPPAAPPSTLTLKSVSGAPSRRLAIINDRTFDVGEQAWLTLATSNVMIRCLEIRSNSVLVQFEGTGVRQELFLPRR